VKSIVTPRGRDESRNVADALGAFREAKAALGETPADAAILNAYVSALGRLFPEARFVMRVADGSAVATASTHRLARDGKLEITEAGLHRIGSPEQATESPAVGVIPTYQPILEAPPRQASHRDGLDAPLIREGTIIGVAAAELDGRRAAPAGLEPALMIAADQVGTLLESASQRRESAHLRDYLDKLLEHANIPVLVVGRDRNIRVVSRAFSRITGMSRQGVVANDLLRLAQHEERVHVLSAFVNVLRGRSVPPFELQLPRVGGGFARLRFKLAPIVDSDGEVAGVIAIGQDRTEVRELEGQVIHAEKLATLGQLAAGIVHEINNPLTSISVYGEYLLGKLSRSGAEPSDVKRIERILRSSDRIMSFTRNLLTYARPSKEEAREVSVPAVLDEAIDFCEHLAREANVTIVPDYANDLPRVHGVAGQLHQVFVNLVTNACNAAGDDGGVLSVRARAGNGRIEIVFEDNGVGIPDEHLAQVFEPFFSTRHKGKGTGLGLSIVKSIVEAHGGEIAIESEVGKRTRVGVTLPSVSR